MSKSGRSTFYALFSSKKVFNWSILSFVKLYPHATDTNVISHVLILTCKHHWQLKSLHEALLGLVVELEILLATILFSNAQFRGRTTHFRLGFILLTLFCQRSLSTNKFRSICVLMSLKRMNFAAQHSEYYWYLKL